MGPDFPKKLWIAAAIVLALGIVMAVDAFWVEPYWIEVTRHRVTAPLAAPLRIAHVTDLHTRTFGRRERSLLALLERERPDVIVVTGDALGIGGYAESRKVLERLHAPLGVWMVRGNWENGQPLLSESTYYRSLGVNLLVNAARPVRNDVWLVGLDDVLSGAPDMRAAFRDVPAGVFRIALLHSPAYFDRVAGRCELALAGGSHGGQVRLPFLEPLWLPPGIGRFVAGWYEGSGSRLYVSRGIGTSLLDARFLCRPELALITVGK